MIELVLRWLDDAGWTLYTLQGPGFVLPGELPKNASVDALRQAAREVVPPGERWTLEIEGGGA